MIKKIPMTGEKLWEVKFREEPNWLLGLYSPDLRSRAEVRKLEKHDVPELFFLVEGEITLVLRDGGETEDLQMKAGEAVILDCWHNAYSPGRERGRALVIEKCGVVTRYEDI